MNLSPIASQSILRCTMTRLFIMVVALALASGSGLSAQELNCEVTINTDQLQNVNRDVFTTLEESMREYFNTTHFTNDQYALNERIDCRFFLTVADYTDNVVKGDIQVQSTRPVYNSAYTTTVLNFKDKNVEFSYQQGEPLTFTVNTMENQLTAILNFYAYFIIALDGDTFAPHGGDEAFERLRAIVQMAKVAGRPLKTRKTARPCWELSPSRRPRPHAICSTSTTAPASTRCFSRPTRDASALQKVSRPSIRFISPTR